MLDCIFCSLGFAFPIAFALTFCAWSSSFKISRVIRVILDFDYRTSWKKIQRRVTTYNFEAPKSARRHWSVWWTAAPRMSLGLCVALHGGPTHWWSLQAPQKPLTKYKYDSWLTARKQLQKICWESYSIGEALQYISNNPGRIQRKVMIGMWSFQGFPVIFLHFQPRFTTNSSFFTGASSQVWLSGFRNWSPGAFWCISVKASPSHRKDWGEGVSTTVWHHWKGDMRFNILNLWLICD